MAYGISPTTGRKYRPRPRLSDIYQTQAGALGQIYAAKDDRRRADEALALQQQGLTQSAEQSRLAEAGVANRFNQNLAAQRQQFDLTQAQNRRMAEENLAIQAEQDKTSNIIGGIGTGVSAATAGVKLHSLLKGPSAAAGGPSAAGAAGVPGAYGSYGAGAVGGESAAAYQGSNLTSLFGGAGAGGGTGTGFGLGMAAGTGAGFAGVGTAASLGFGTGYASGTGVGTMLGPGGIGIGTNLAPTGAVGVGAGTAAAAPASYAAGASLAGVAGPLAIAVFGAMKAYGISKNRRAKTDFYNQNEKHFMAQERAAEKATGNFRGYRVNLPDGTQLSVAGGNIDPGNRGTPQITGARFTDEFGQLGQNVALPADVLTRLGQDPALLDFHNQYRGFNTGVAGSRSSAFNVGINPGLLSQYNPYARNQGDLGE